MKHFKKKDKDWQSERLKPATDRQKKYFLEREIPFDEKMTKGQASRKITDHKRNVHKMHLHQNRKMTGFVGNIFGPGYKAKL